MPIELTLYVAYAGVVVLMALTPGTDNIYVLTRTLSHGRSAGFLAASGIAIALCVHVTAITLGLSQLFLSAPDLYAAVRWAGIAYLLWLAWKAFRASPDTELSAGRGGVLSKSRVVGQAFMLCLLNPKLAVFFIAFLPQFTNPDNGTMSLQLFTLGVTFALISLTVFSTAILFVAPIGDALRHHASFWKWQARISGGVLGAMALWLALDER
ncbi:MAG: LysE family translocator [Rhodospirillales bacterium]|jgi:threonine/homoserine/homoserine lactone efflux protein|nr:LysE family translocator [Rhodospirillales bacterium]MBT4041617.1 LysE family translocator [Rhodospirillales bacterium]MBT4625328.1 LysE family translocator [Rhodospirillales bacterium]MBT5351901.1 LysE family translocator [Rhodospirillales bacterium]MBT5521577.1 LysE family translocator [Rhodospirillales bacterium]